MSKSILHEIPQGKVIGSFINPSNELVMGLNIQLQVRVDDFLENLLNMVREGRVRDEDALKLASKLEQAASAIRYILASRW